jgi:hypothetical protein
LLLLRPIHRNLAGGDAEDDRRLSIALSLGLSKALGNVQCHTPPQVGRRGDDGREVGGLRGRSGGVRQRGGP